MLRELLHVGHEALFDCVWGERRIADFASVVELDGGWCRIVVVVRVCWRRFGGEERGVAAEIEIPHRAAFVADEARDYNARRGVVERCCG